MTETKKKSSFLSWLLWWQIDESELKSQVDNYYSLGLTKSARGVSTLLLLLSSVATFGFVYFFALDSSALLDVFIYLFLAVFIYKGFRWFMVAAMVIWTFEKFYMLVDQSGVGGNPIIAIIWWAVYLHYFWLAFKVEQVRKKSQKNSTTRPK